MRQRNVGELPLHAEPLKIGEHRRTGCGHLGRNRRSDEVRQRFTDRLPEVQAEQLQDRHGFDRQKGCECVDHGFNALEIRGTEGIRRNELLQLRNQLPGDVLDIRVGDLLAGHLFPIRLSNLQKLVAIL
ncbi:MAG: hypothetical protein WA964_06675 [Ilumatobacter sp.]|uniref:hypothetical protein n=1 Tax=Ilumatobacter sp. TaxID=1967498 RepID=UPI003C72BB31